MKTETSLDLHTMPLDVTHSESIAVAETERTTNGRGVDVLLNDAEYGQTGRWPIW